MRMMLQGGFGEKGRTSVALEADGTTIMLDAGIKVGAGGADYFPRLARPASDIGALFITHAHEDHIGALGWLIESGFRGPVFMTRETAAETPAMLAQYAVAGQAGQFASADIRLFQPGERIEFGGFTVESGRSGHVAGGVWFAAAAGGGRVVYCGDVVPGSAVFHMDPLPDCELILLDASYGDDDVGPAARAAQIADWIGARPGGCLLPTPLSGRSLELVAAMPGAFAIHAEMRAGLAAQLETESDFRAGMRDRLAALLERATDWHDGDALPAMPLMCHDGMGTNGPSAHLIDRADREGHPILLTGHLPEGSPGARLKAAGRADFIRMPTHPTRGENRALWEEAGQPAVLGHSCPPDMLAGLAEAIPPLRTDLATGAAFDLDEQ